MAIEITSVTTGPNSTLEKPKLINIDPPKEGQILVKLKASALNPTDVQTLDGQIFPVGHTLGCDFSGVVEQVGKGVTKFNVGDEVASFVWGGLEKGRGAYSTHIIAEADYTFKVPESIDFGQAASIPLASCTAWIALLSPHSLSIPRTYKDAHVLIWGGASSVGMYSVQIARNLGFKVISTASPKNFDLVKSLGADHVVDYNDTDQNVLDNIKKIDSNIIYAFDTIGNLKTSTLCGSVVSGNAGAIICTVRPGCTHTEGVPKDVKVTDVIVYTAFGKEIKYRESLKLDVRPDDIKLGLELFESIPGWISNKKFVPNPVTTVGTGLEMVPKAYQLHRDGKVSGTKLIIQHN